MNFALSHSFIEKCEEAQRSINFLHGRTEWFLIFKRRKDGYIDFTLYGSPFEDYVRPGVHWEISADVKGTLGNRNIPNRTCCFSGSEKKESSFSGTSFFENSTNGLVYNPYIEVINGQIVVNLKIRNIETEGIRYFKQLDFSESNLLGSDLSLLVGAKKLFCHSQILSLKSPVFTKILKENDHPREDPLEIELDPEIYVEDFMEFLHQLYSPEPIREDNWEILLNFAGKYEVAQILFCCEKFLLEKLLETDQSLKTRKAIEMIPISFRYSLEFLKSKCFSLLYGCNDRRQFTIILIDKYYLAMDDIKKLELLQFILKETD